MHIPRTLFPDSEAQERALLPEAPVFLPLDLKPVLPTVQPPPDSGRGWCACDFPDTGRVFSDHAPDDGRDGQTQRMPSPVASQASNPVPGSRAE